MLMSAACIDALGIRDVADVEQQSVAAARATGQTDVRIDGDVVTLIRAGVSPVRGPPAAWDLRHRAPAPRAARRAAAGARLDLRRLRRWRLTAPAVPGRFHAPRRRSQTVEDTRRAHDRRLLRRRNRHSDDLETEPRAVRIFDRTVLAAGELVGRPHARRARHVDVDVLLVARIGHDGVRVRAAARLHVRDVLRMRRCLRCRRRGSAQPVLADRLRHALDAAIDAPVCPSPDTNSRFLYTDTSLCDAGQT